MRRPACSIMRRTRSGRADRRSNWRRVAPRSSAAGSVAPSRGEREPSRRRSPQPPAASRQPYSRTAVSRQLAVAVAAAAAAAVSELLRRVADAVWTRAAQRRASVLGVGSARARADGACKQTACTAHSFKIPCPRERWATRRTNTSQKNSFRRSKIVDLSATATATATATRQPRQHAFT